MSTAACAASCAASCDLPNFIELIAPFLSCRDLSRLAQTSKNINEAAAAVEEEVYATHKIAKAMHKSIIKGTAALCTHITSECSRTQMTVPLPFGLSSKGMLRAVLEHKDIWKNADVCVRVHLQEKYYYQHEGKYPLTYVDELLFVTQTYSDNICKRLAWTSVGFH